MTTVGIIGFGSFGQFLAKKLSPHCTIKVFSPRGTANDWSASLEEVAICDYVILGVPLGAYQQVLTDLKSLLAANTVIVDVASVKEKPVALVQELLPGRRLVSTHPLFGPESAKDSLQDHTLVMCPETSDPKAFAVVKEFAVSLGLKVVEMTEQEHDKEMAMVHALTFFIAHSLKDMKLHDQKLSTGSFKKLLSLAELERHHSDELFATIQQGNPYAAEVREAFLEHAKALDQSISVIR
jgi:prephenate dehydrogenase